MRRFVYTVLQKYPELEIVGGVVDGLEAVQKAGELHPDVILLDIGLPTLDGIEVARRLRRISTESKILFVSQESSDDVVQEALTDFVKEGIFDLMPVGGVHVDPTDHSVWCATNPGEKNRSEIVHFDTHGKILERYTPSTTVRHVLNDLVLRGSHEIYVTDTKGNRKRVAPFFGIECGPSGVRSQRHYGFR